MTRCNPARTPPQRPPYGVWHEGTEVEAGVGWILRLVGQAMGTVAAGRTVLGQAETALAYLEHVAPGRITSDQARTIREVQARADALYLVLDDLAHALAATATLR